MPAPHTGPLRALRASAVVGAVLVPTTAAHAAGGGALNPVGVGVLAALVWPLALFLTRRQVSGRLLVPVLALTQSLAHVLLALVGHRGPGRPCLVPTGHLHTAALSCSAGSPAGSEPPNLLSSVTTAWVGAGTSMMAAHVGALLVTSLLLARGEALLWRVAETLVALVLRPRVAPVWRATRRVAPPRHLLASRCAPQVVRGIGLVRGPPSTQFT